MIPDSRQELKSNTLAEKIMINKCTPKTTFLEKDSITMDEIGIYQTKKDGFLL